MEENNFFNSNESNSENVNDGILNCDNDMQNKTGDFEENTVINDDSKYEHATEIHSENEESFENEIEIDPDIENYASDNKVINDDISSQESFEPFKDESMPPVMPKINTNPYVPTEKGISNNGMKVFATIVALLVLISGCITGGYFFGKQSNSVNSKVTVDLASKPSAENAITVSQIYNEVNPSIVGIYVYNSTGITASATGVIYSEDGYIVTNDHIYSETSSPKFKVYTSDGKSYDADFIAGDTRSDLAVLKVKNPVNFKPATFGNSDELAVGESVVAVGRPNGATENAIASEGVISSVSRRVAITSSYTGNYIQTDSAINPGSSGGALCNIYGQVIGITSAKIVGDEYEGVGFAIPTTTMKKNVDLLIEHKYIKGRAKLGISYLAINELTSEIEGTPMGLQIASIDQSSDLYGKSVEIGDIITKVNGETITSSETVLSVIDKSSAGDTLTLTIYSVTKKTSFEVTVKLLEDEGGSSFNTSDASSNSTSSGNYNESEFNFPNGD